MNRNPISILSMLSFILLGPHFACSQNLPPDSNIYDLQDMANQSDEIYHWATEMNNALPPPGTLGLLPIGMRYIESDNLLVLDFLASFGDNSYPVRSGWTHQRSEGFPRWSLKITHRDENGSQPADFLIGYPRPTTLPKIKFRPGQSPPQTSIFQPYRDFRNIALTTITYDANAELAEHIKAYQDRAYYHIYFYCEGDRIQLSELGFASDAIKTSCGINQLDVGGPAVSALLYRPAPIVVNQEKP